MSDQIGWYCTNCGHTSALEPTNPCPMCDCAIWERGDRRRPTMPEIERWHPQEVTRAPKSIPFDPPMERLHNGAFVTHSDHQAYVAARDEEIERLVVEVDYWEEAARRWRKLSEQALAQRDTELRERLEAELDKQASGVLRLAAQALDSGEAVRARKLEDDAAVTRNVKALLLEHLFKGRDDV